MASCQVNLPDDFTSRLSKLADHTDQIVQDALEAGGEIALGKVKGNLAGAIGKATKEPSRSTGELLGSLGLSPAKPKRDGSGWDIKVGFAEPRKGGGSNAKIANVLEYGRHGQPARPFLRPAKTASKGAASQNRQQRRRH